MQLLLGSGLDVRVQGQEVVEEGRSALHRPDDDEVGQRPRLRIARWGTLRPLLLGIELPF